MIRPGGSSSILGAVASELRIRRSWWCGIELRQIPEARTPKGCKQASFRENWGAAGRLELEALGLAFRTTHNQP